MRCVEHGQRVGTVGIEAEVVPLKQAGGMSVTAQAKQDQIEITDALKQMVIGVGGSDGTPLRGDAVDL